MSQAGLGSREQPLYKGTLGAWDWTHEPSPLHTRRVKSQHHQNSSSTSTTPALSVSCTPPLPPYFPYHVMGPGVLVSRGHLALLPHFSARVSLPRLALARSATPSRPGYRRLGLHSLGWHPTAPLPYAALAISPRLHHTVVLSRRMVLPRCRMSTPWVLELCIQHRNGL